MTNSRSSRMLLRLVWSDSFDEIECKTLVSISLLIDGTPVWPVKGDESGSFEWYADELLSHLAECWKPLILRQTYPIPVQPSRPSFLLAEASRRWSGLPEVAADAEREDVSAFEDVHNLANAFGGVSGLLPLWFLRDGDMAIVDTQDHLSRIPLGDAIVALVSAGDEIAKRLHEADSEKWFNLVAAWNHRHRGDPTAILAFAIGQDKETAAALVEEDLLQAPKSFDDAANDNDELRIAARMAGPMPLSQMKMVLQKVRSCSLRSAPRLKTIALEATKFLAIEKIAEARPYTQGNELAMWLRRTLTLRASQRVDPIRVLEHELNVDVRVIDFAIPSLDAVAVWGAHHGPGVLLNKTSIRIPIGKNIWQSGALRVTAAHELCHLLVDARHTLSAVDILGGRMPVRIEQRAKAFAAEFLLPMKDAGDLWRDSGYTVDPESVHGVIKRLCRTHNVTKSVAAWQLQHGAPQNNWDELGRILDQLIPHR